MTNDYPISCAVCDNEEALLVLVVYFKFKQLDKVFIILYR